MPMIASKGSLIPTLIAAVLGFAAVVLVSGSASAAESIELEVPLGAAQLQRSAEAVAVHSDYETAYREAKKLRAIPKSDGSAIGRNLSTVRLRRRTAELEQRIRKAKRRARIPSPQSVGVSSGTLEAIAACESGGSPTAVSSNGSYRGKYQFSYGTWAGVGGSGDPAAASEAEQDYRAALLYARSGSGSWPVCG